MDTRRACRSCQKPIAPGTPLGLCPQCLILSGFPSGVETEGEPSGRHAFVPPTAESLATLFPQLEILQLLGKGGMGAVYKARQKQLNRLVALKILPPGIGAELAFAERFTREAQALAQLNHPGIVTLYEFGQAGGMPFFLMEYVDGINLAQALANGRVSPREALSIVPQICDALQFAHDQGIVHRDIKPENILLDRHGRVKVADFGLAILAGGSAEPGVEAGGAGGPSQLTEAGKVVGTPRYMSPEQLEQPGQVDQRADIYALGVVFYQMLTGELPGKPVEPPSKRVQIDMRLDEVVLHALEQDPARRYARASQLKTQIEAIAATPAPANAAPGGGARFSRMALAGAAWLLCCVAAVAYVAACGLPLSGGRGFREAFLATLGHLLLALSLSGSFGVTILGWLAVSEIRRSAGRLWGLGLAVFDGLFFPLLVLVFFARGTSLFLAFGALGEVLRALVLDALLTWPLWRALSRPAARQGPGASPAPDLVHRALRTLALASLGLGVLGLIALTLFWCGRLTDNIELPFVDDPPAVGRWTTVDVVDSPAQFTPGAQYSKFVPPLKELVLLPGGKSPQSWRAWTKGVIIHKNDRTASHYELKEIDGSRFMFMERKSGDYILLRHKPTFYVLRWSGSVPGEPAGTPAAPVMEE